MQSTQHGAWHVAMFCKCYQFTVLLLSQLPGGLSSRVYRDAVKSVHDPSGKPVSSSLTFREAPVALRPNSGSTSLRHPLLSTTPHLQLGVLGCSSPIFPEHTLHTPLRLLPHCVSYFICLVVSYYHQTGGGQRYCFIHICIPEHRSMPQRRRCAIFADHRKEGGRKGSNRHYI